MEHDADVVAIGTGTGPGGETVPAVILAVREECLPIFVSPDQAQSIGMALEGEPFERPLAHDLLLELLTEFGGAVNRVRIDDLIDGTFYAKVDVERYDEGQPERFVFDARPSDALALAARVDCPIVVSGEIVDRAGQPPETVGFDVGGPSDAGLVDEPDADLVDESDADTVGESDADTVDEPFDDPRSDVEEEFDDAFGERSPGGRGERSTEEREEGSGDDSEDDGVDGGGSDDAADDAEDRDSRSDGG